MKKKDYKRLGDYIREVDVRNKDLSISQLVGLTINKSFIPSVANVIGTDLSNYKVIQKEQFACSLMQVSRDGKIPVAMFDDESAIMSPAYPMFEVIDKTKLLPQYLMMWFRRTEFDREASFYAVGGVRGSLTWEDFCDMSLPIPSLEEQRKIVSDYETLTRRIKLNEQMIQKLEDTAQTIFRKMFVDDIDSENLPEGWRMGTLGDIANYLNGMPCQNYLTTSDSYYPVLKIKELSQGYCDDNSDHANIDFPKAYLVSEGDVIFSWSATLLVDIWCDGKSALNQHLFKVSSDKYPKWFYFIWTKYYIKFWKRLISAKATSMGHIKREDINNAQVIIPSRDSLLDMDSIFTPLFRIFYQKKKENLLYREMQSLILSQI